VLIAGVCKLSRARPGSGGVIGICEEQLAEEQLAEELARAQRTGAEDNWCHEDNWDNWCQFIFPSEK
jgi:hypothetical protein